MMFASIRVRLLASYLAVLAVAFGALIAALLVILNTSGAPPQPTYQRLATQALDINWRDLLDGGLFQRPGQIIERLKPRLAEVAQQRGVRILIITLPNPAPGAGGGRPPVAAQVVFDSRAAFMEGSRLDARIESSTLAAPVADDLVLRVESIVGGFSDADGEWLFVGLESLRVAGQANAIIFAAPRPTQTLQAAFEQFGANLAPLVLQAGLVGVVVAVLLAAWIARGIARPLQALSSAVAAAADGSHSERVAVTGPREIRAVAEAFNQMSEHVRAEQSAQQDFVANVSHDLKTPLTSIQGFSQAIIDGAAADPVKAAQIIYDEAARLNRLVTELTDLTRLQAGRLSMRATPIDLGQLTAAVAQRLTVVARDKGVRLRVDAAAMPEIAGDGDRLAQVLNNLIGNAIKYTPAGGGVGVRTEVRRHGVAVVIQDTGVGIPPAELERIFERFYQVDKARGPQRGTGLGLAIVREIVHAHGGTITVESPGVNQGSTFTVWFPSPGMTTLVRRRA
jgi:signal transduction histidine kinase